MGSIGAVYFRGGAEDGEMAADVDRQGLVEEFDGDASWKTATLHVGFLDRLESDGGEPDTLTQQNLAPSASNFDKPFEPESEYLQRSSILIRDPVRSIASSAHMGPPPTLLPFQLGKNSPRVCYERARRLL